MPVLPLAENEAKRGVGDLPGLPFRNMYVEPDPTNQVDGLVRLQRPGLELWQTVGSGPIHNVFRRVGLFGSDYFVHSGAEMYRVNSAGIASLVGTLASTRSQIANSGDKIIAVAGAFAYSYDGTTWRVINMPEGFPVQSVAFLAGFFVLSVLGGQRMYFMDSSESDPDPFSFFEAERLPDGIVSLGINGDELWAFGERGEQVYFPSGDADAPFQLIGGRAYENGCAARDTMVEVDNAIIWVSADYNVMLGQGVPQIISKPDIAEWLRTSLASSMRAWSFKLDQHQFYVVTAGAQSWCYDLATERWFRWSSYNRDDWRAHRGAELIAGDSASAKLYRLVPGRSNDDGEAMVREISGMVEVVGRPPRCDSVSLRAAVGHGSALQDPSGVVATGFWDDAAVWDDSAPWYDFPPISQVPRIEMRWSDDEGNLWTDWRAVTLGLQGQYRKPIVWRKLGLMRRPGRIFHWRSSDDVELRISHAHWNEAVS